MTKWIFRGIRTGIKTTSYPRSPELAPGVTPGRPGGRQGGDESIQGIERCPTGALSLAGDQIGVDYRRCVHCFRCQRGAGSVVGWQSGYEWGSRDAARDDDRAALGCAFQHSLHIRVVDCGACGACLSEIEQTNKPYYNMHRLGFFVTPTPRTADVLLLAGPLTEHMRHPLSRAYNAMPTPKRVIAVGTCALSGGPFGPSFASNAGVTEAVPVDVFVPGCPPPPLAIIHALLLLVGRTAPSTLDSARSAEGIVTP